MLERRVRTAKYLVFRTRENPWKQRETGGRESLSCGGFRVLHLRPLGQLSVYVIPHFFQKLLERTDGKNNKIFNFRTGENPVFMGFLSGANSQLYKKFRVSHLRPLGQLSIYLKCNPCSGRMQEKHARTIWNCEIRTRAKPCAADIFSGRNGRSFQKFRVNPVMTASIRFHIRLKYGKTRFAHTILSVLREKVKRFLAKRLTYTGQCGYNNCVLWCLDILFSHG